MVERRQTPRPRWPNWALLESKIVVWQSNKIWRQVPRRTVNA
jgi:hypothetical protein